ncbi:MAG: response regulator [Deltaproteobacteria bacterium]|nr:MAG: response regulator [Deltaproteobacteria bacterium]
MNSKPLPTSDSVRRDVTRHLPPAPVARPLREVLAAVFVLGFGLWAAWLTVTVAGERALVEERVGWLIEARQVEGYVEARAPAAVPALQDLRGDLLRSKASDALVAPLNDALVALGDGRHEEAEVALGRFIGAVRADNGQISTQLGARWNALTAVVGIALLFGAALVAALVAEQRRRRELDRWQVGLESALIEVQQARERAEAADRLKTRMLANMSHELRSPLTAVSGMIDLTVDLVDGRAAEQLEVAGRAAGHLARLVDDLLDLSRLQAGAVKIQAEPVALRTLLHDLVRLYETRVDAEHVRFAIEVDERVPPVVRTDPVRLRQLLEGLLTNAIRYAPHGTVTLGLAQQKGRLRFTVADEGPGIPEEEHERIFQPFIQGSGRVDARVGTGLGLAIAREVVLAMGGRIGVDSRPGAGATFWFELPDLGGTETPSVREFWPDAVRVSGPILVVDDDAVIRRVSRGLLEQLGYTVVEASSGDQAIHAWQAEKPAAILMDWHMDGMDGLEASRRIRALETVGRVPIIALTARNLVGDRSEVLDAGLDDHLTKPIDRRRLLRALARWVGTPTPPLEPVVRDTRLLDIQELLANVGTRAVATKVLELWLSEVAELRLDDDVLEREVHRLKGSSASIGARRLSESCGVLLDAMREGLPAELLVMRVQRDVDATTQAVRDSLDHNLQD